MIEQVQRFDGGSTIFGNMGGYNVALVKEVERDKYRQLPLPPGVEGQPGDTAPDTELIEDWLLGQ